MLTARAFFTAALTMLFMLGGVPRVQAQSEQAMKDLSAAYKLLQDGETSKAIAKVEEVLKKTPSDSAAAAKAMLMRAEAHEKTGKTIKALADFDAALWLQGLSSSERERAVAGRKRLMARLGIAGSSSKEDVSAAPESAGKAATSAPAASERRRASGERAGSWQTAVEDRKGEAGTGAGDSSLFSQFFQGIFGASDTTKPAESSNKQAPTVSSWSQGTAVTSVEERRDAQVVDERPQEYRVQLAAVASAEEAKAEAERLRRLHASALGGRAPGVVRTDTAAGNTYYRVMVGPMPDRIASQELCQKIKAQGGDCLVVLTR